MEEGSKFCHVCEFYQKARLRRLDQLTTFRGERARERQHGQRRGAQRRAVTLKKAFRVSLSDLVSVSGSQLQEEARVQSYSHTLAILQRKKVTKRKTWTNFFRQNRGAVSTTCIAPEQNDKKHLVTFWNPLLPEEP
ncbi:hypothetical protein PoB_005769200 [Plakobranchus ocellatus]|uniref:Uncharacterized protein n=1 Tax=Plakobranchus ocellatus TaxID=259542 RepID=A0AAV4CIL2_9GAST|nr:hypothetical protein PoB_005769200 [Plakobranchus ocellatus]